MKVIKVIFMVAITIALTITLITKTPAPPQQLPSTSTANYDEPNPIKVSRFLAEKYKNPRASDHCHKDNAVCYLESTLQGGSYYNSTCCNNKCVDLAYDNMNCGVCKNKCEYTEACCRGKCVKLAFDKRHCGSCGNRCSKGLSCIYGMCEYP